MQARAVDQFFEPTSLPRSTGGAHGAGSLIYFAWMLEIVGVGCGVVSAAFTTFHDDFPNSAIGWLPALPLVVLAMAELLRIPLAQAFSQKKRWLARMLALAALIPLCGITVENWTFGIERIVTLRLHDVEPKRVALRAAEAAVSDLQAAVENRRQRLEVDRANGEKLKAENQRQLDRLAEQRAVEISGHSKALGTIADCKISPDPTCYTQRSRYEDARHKEAMDRLAAEEVRITAAMASRDAAMAHSTNDDAGMDAAKRAVNLAHGAYTDALSQNQIYRLAGVFYGVTPEKISDAQLVNARGFFSFFSACVIAVIGLAAALIHYWPDWPASSSRSGVAFGRLLRSVRGYIARRRKVITVNKIVEVEKVVPLQIVERPVLIVREHTTYLPYTGAGQLPEVKTVETRIEGKAAQEAHAAARANNLTLLQSRP